jgi:hypothetical protein
VLGLRDEPDVIEAHRLIERAATQLDAHLGARYNLATIAGESGVNSWQSMFLGVQPPDDDADAATVLLFSDLEDTWLDLFTQPTVQRIYATLDAGGRLSMAPRNGVQARAAAWRATKARGGAPPADPTG